MITDGESPSDLLRGVVINVETFLPAQTVEYIWRSIEAGEWKIAYEDLCTQLDEYEVGISPGVYRSLVELGTLGKFDPDTWETLRIVN